MVVDGGLLDILLLLTTLLDLLNGDTTEGAEGLLGTTNLLLGVNLDLDLLVHAAPRLSPPQLLGLLVVVVQVVALTINEDQKLGGREKKGTGLRRRVDSEWNETSRKYCVRMAAKNSSVPAFSKTHIHSCICTYTHQYKKKHRKRFDEIEKTDERLEKRKSSTIITRETIRESWYGIHECIEKLRDIVLFHKQPITSLRRKSKQKLNRERCRTRPP